MSTHRITIAYKFIFFIALALLLSSQTSTVLGATTTTATPTVHDPIAVEEAVRDKFSDATEMIEVARCESKFRQYTDSDNVLRGGWNNQMIGVFQFFDTVHSEAATELGFDITILEGNLNYARHVYDTQGLTPWNSSRSCWETNSAVATTAADTPAADATRAELLKKIELLQKLIALLEQIQSLKKLQAGL